MAAFRTFRSIAIFYLTCFYMDSTVVVQAKCRKCSSAHKSKSRPVPSPRLPPPPSPDKNFPGAIFHVTEYGAVADGETDSTSVRPCLFYSIC